MIFTTARSQTAVHPSLNETPAPAAVSASGRTQWWRAALLMVLFGGMVHGLSQAQTGQGVITGQVTDNSGARIAGATVEVKNNDTGVVITGVSDKAGIYNVQPLLPGTYTVSITRNGFQTSVTNQVNVNAAQTTTTNVKLLVGSESMAVTVNAQANDLAKNTSDVETTVEHHLVEDLPYPERSALEAVLLVPGVTGDPLQPGGISSENPNYATGAVSPAGSLRVGGSIPGTTPIYVDGSDVTQASYPHAGAAVDGDHVGSVGKVWAHGRWRGHSEQRAWDERVSWRRRLPAYRSILPGLSRRQHAAGGPPPEFLCGLLWRTGVDSEGI
jgi:hypothetical protein